MTCADHGHDLPHETCVGVPWQQTQVAFNDARVHSFMRCHSQLQIDAVSGTVCMCIPRAVNIAVNCDSHGLHACIIHVAEQRAECGYKE